MGIVGVRTAGRCLLDVGDRWQVLVAGLCVSCGLEIVELRASSLVFWKQNQP